RAVEVALLLPDDPAHVVGAGIDRIEADRLVEVGDRAVGVALVVPYVAAIGIGEREFRVEPDRLVVVRDGAVVVALVLPDIAAVVERLGIFRIDADRIIVVRERRIGVVLLPVRDRAVVVGDGEVVALGLAGLDDPRAGLDRRVGGGVLVLADRPVVGPCGGCRKADNATHEQGEERAAHL